MLCSALNGGDGCDQLRVQILEQDRLKDDFIGFVDIDLTPFHQPTRSGLVPAPAPLWFDVTQNGAAKTGSVRLQFTFTYPSALGLGPASVASFGNSRTGSSLSQQSTQASLGVAGKYTGAKTFAAASGLKSSTATRPGYHEFVNNMCTYSKYCFIAFWFAYV